MIDNIRRSQLGTGNSDCNVQPALCRIIYIAVLYDIIVFTHPPCLHDTLHAIYTI